MIATVGEHFSAISDEELEAELARRRVAARPVSPPAARLRGFAAMFSAVAVIILVVVLVGVLAASGNHKAASRNAVTETASAPQAKALRSDFKRTFASKCSSVWSPDCVPMSEIVVSGRSPKATVTVQSGWQADGLGKTMAKQLCNDLRILISEKADHYGIAPQSVSVNGADRPLAWVSAWNGHC